ncbi:DnaJ C-terminal domain-containing protein [Hyphomicrobium sp.]|uniref:DnaJ C-terminal domain-containing protein n=1 Tax=Hyphomicrobium sp. TaxID=82 RepID=UPI002D77F3F9|nr:DnaJ C-terminal domain-containing protein [Hyphomicrobium sp.]HET6389675.1 DnaJ C-terminal domain-containing protein [Hyphomicrobium sp.]
MAEDLYEILGVSRGATEAEIRAAFRKAAKANHPDVNPNNVAAAERFKKITAANDILSDPEKRRQYDAGEIDAKGDLRRPQWSRAAGARGGYSARGFEGRPGATGFDDFSFTDIFSDVFGSGGGRRTSPSYAPRGQDLRYSLEVDFLEAVLGAKKRVTLPDGGVLDLAVPEGVMDGQTLRLKGKGTMGAPGSEPGDALIEIKVRPHPDFKREGDDILLELPITIDEAVLGGRVEVPTPTGRVQLNVPKGTSSGKTFRLKGKGVRGRSGLHGDQLVTVKIVLPQDIDDSLSYFFSEWRQKHAYDPGRK